MKTYKITLTFSNPYIGSRNGGNRTLSDKLSLHQAYKELLDMYNEKFGCERSYASNWGIAVLQSRRFADGACETFPDGTRCFSWDSRTFQIEEENA